MNLITIDSEKICLREISDSDTESIIKWRNNNNVKKNFIYQKDFTVEDHKNWLNTKVKTGEVKQFIIVEKQSGIDIGSVYLRDIDYNNLKSEFGIFIGEESYLNKGYGTIAAKLIIKYAFLNLNLNKIFLRVFEHNAHAIHSYEKVGFVKEGIFKQDVYINNKFYNVVFMGILKNGDLYV